MRKTAQGYNQNQDSLKTIKKNHARRMQAVTHANSNESQNGSSTSVHSVQGDIQAAPATTAAGTFPKCAASLYIGGTISSPAHANTNPLCTYSPNQTCCNAASFTNMKSWWENKSGSNLESRADRYHRRFFEAIKYTYYLLNWRQAMLDIANEIASNKQADAYCKAAAENFQNVNLQNHPANTFYEKSKKCVTFLTAYTNASVAGTCNPIASSYYDIQSKRFTWSSTVALAAGDACADLVVLQNTHIVPYLDVLAPLVRCKKGITDTSRPNFSREACSIQNNEANLCRGTTDTVEPVPPKDGENCGVKVSKPIDDDKKKEDSDTNSSSPASTSTTPAPAASTTPAPAASTTPAPAASTTPAASSRI